MYHSWNFPRASLILGMTHLIWHILLIEGSPGVHHIGRHCAVIGGKEGAALALG